MYNISAKQPGGTLVNKAPGGHPSRLVQYPSHHVNKKHAQSLPRIPSKTPASAFQTPHRQLTNKYAPRHSIGPSAAVPQQPSKKPGSNDVYPKHLASELKRIANPKKAQTQTEPPRSSLPPVFNKPQGRHRSKSIDNESLKRDLLDIHRRNSVHTSKKKKRHSKMVNPLHEEDDQLDDQLPNASMDMDAKNVIDLASYTKDYIHLSKEYKQMEKYRVCTSKRDTSHQPACVSCSRRSRYLDKVFFPCEHMCVCDVCLDRKMPKQCPLCKATIRVVLNHTGNENEEYWKWVEEVSSMALFIPTVDVVSVLICGIVVFLLYHILFR
mmetsp:Transcript_23722/g.37337  ORF Transcript_23722/g.37337 Transcript_23722/m.37337 type:complete len:324 (+) Transcript_23722:193-1164(+)